MPTYDNRTIRNHLREAGVYPDCPIDEVYTWADSRGLMKVRGDEYVLDSEKARRYNAECRARGEDPQNGGIP